MKTFIIYLSLLFAGFSSVTANNGYTQTIRGTVMDAVTAFPLIGATIILEGTNPPVGAITDADGVFVLNDVPVGRQTLEISYVGYLPRKVENLLLTSAKEVVIQIQLEESTVLDDCTPARNSVLD